MSDSHIKDRKAHEEKLSWVNKEFAVAIVFIGVIYYLRSYFPLDATKLKTSHDRLTFTLQWLFLSSLTILFAIFGVLNVRGNTDAIDPIGGAAEHLVEFPNRILRNTTEQFFLHAVGLLTLTTYLDETCMRDVPLLVILFLFGRLFFWIGYKSSPMNRGFGFAITFLPTLVVYGYCLYRFAKTFIF